MAAPQSRRRVRAAAIAAAAGCLVALSAWRYGPWRERYAVPVPPASASPAQVVRAYLRALGGHDSGTAIALSAPGYRSTTRYWLGRTASIRVLRIGAVQHDRGGAPGERYDVPADFTYSAYRWEPYDPSFWNGPHDWEYWLLRAHGRWLISDQGTG